MSLPVAVRRYLEKRALSHPWHIEGDLRHDYQGAVVIPALAESANLFATLASLQANPASVLEEFLVVVVVNHRQAAAASDKQDNYLTLRKLTEAVGILPNLGWIDAASDGLELPAKGGVGLARKIGLDLVLERLDWTGARILANLDADTLVRADYLPALNAHFASAEAGGAVVPYCHPVAGDRAQQQAMVAYELYLRGHVLGLQWAGSPYAFHTVGSTMACRAGDYVRSGGMNRRQAGEDFYFLQQLAKTSGVGSVVDTVVYPSARISERTPFGTGRSVAQLAADGSPPRLYYDPRCYEMLRDWLHLVTAYWQSDCRELMERVADVSGSLTEFLLKENLQEVWPRLCRNHADRQSRLKAFHGWFDGLKTTRLIHHLTDAGWPRQAAAEAIPPLLRRVGLPAVDEPQKQLMLLRQRQIGTSCASCSLSEKSNCCRVA